MDAAQIALLPCSVAHLQIIGETGDRYGHEVVAGTRLGRKRTEDAFWFGRISAAVLRCCRDQCIYLGVMWIIKERRVGGDWEERRLSGHVLFDHRDAILTDAQRVVAAEWKIGALLVLMHVGDGEKPGEPRDLERLRAGVGVRCALEHPGLIERVHGAPLAFTVDAEVVADVGVDLRPPDLPLVLRMRDRNEQRTSAPSEQPPGAGNGEAGVDPEGHHHVLVLIVQVPEVCEVTRIDDGDLMSAGSERGDEILRG